MISDHVPTRDRCEKLRALGMPQETIFSWAFLLDNKEWDTYSWHVILKKVFSKKTQDESVAAPIATEILEWLPTTTMISKQDKYYALASLEGLFADDILPNALADLLIWCVEQGHVTWEVKG